jgi:membrane-bound lytic murein transglycosylase D
VGTPLAFPTQPQQIERLWQEIAVCAINTENGNLDMKNQLFISMITLIASLITLFLATTMFVKSRIFSANLPGQRNSGRSVAADPSKPLIGISPLDRQSLKFLEIVKGLEPLQECLPVSIESQPEFDLEYLYCTDDALAKDGNAQTLTANFEVTRGLARRYNFWRRVYSNFSSKQHILHLAEYPEVVLEIYDLSNRPQMAYHEERKAIVQISKRQKEYYRSLFRQLDKYRDADISTYSPDMKRVARLMQHIDDKNKYLIAASSIRTQTGQRNYVAQGILQGTRYLTEIENEFDRQGVPRELARLAFVESSFNLNAKSKVGASGVYQIMFNTGKQYLKIVDGIDERNDPIKAARAAAKLLRMNYGITKSWPLAITAYNHGVGSMTRAVRTTGSMDIEIIIRKYRDRNFGFASKNFYTEYLAMLGTLQDAHKLFPDESRPSPIIFQSVRLPNSMQIAMVRKKYKISDAQIEDLNRDIFRQHIRKNGVLPQGFNLKIPVAKSVVSAIYSAVKPET